MTTPERRQDRASVSALGLVADAHRADRRGRPADVLDVLAREHRRFDHRCLDLLASSRRRRHELERFAIDLLAHEALEQVLLHPVVADRLPHGHQLRIERLREERLLERSVQCLLALPAAGRAGTAALAALHRQLVEHDDREELEIFPFLRHDVTREQLDRDGALYEVVHRYLAELPVAAVLDLDRVADPTTRPLERLRALATQALAGPPGR